MQSISRFLGLLVVLVWIGCLGIEPSWADDETAKPDPAVESAEQPAESADATKSDEAAPVVEKPIAVTINGEPIYVEEVNALWDKISKSRQWTVKPPDQTRAELLREIMYRRVVEQMLLRNDAFVTEAEIKKEFDRLDDNAQAHRTTLDKLLASKGVTREVLRHEIIWGVGWKRYLERNLAEALEGYFDQHRKELDGTEMHVRHILFRSDRAGPPNDQMVQLANKVREEIESGKITFDDAVQKYSAGPSKQRGGDLGFIPRYGAIAEDFAKAAFALDKGQISEPVPTTFGVHLIRIEDIKSGEKQWTELIAQIQQAAASDMFLRVARQQLQAAKLEFTGLVPYLKPPTDELVKPRAAAKK